MNHASLRRLQEVFQEALGVPPAERGALLERLCESEEIRRDVDRLLELHDEAQQVDFLGRPMSFPADATPVKSHGPTAFQPEELIAGRFRIVRFVGQGGMGEVYEAKDELVPGEVLALKTLRPLITNDPRAVARFKREMALARKVTHPNVCRVFDIATHRVNSGPDVTFLTMEFLKGEDLSRQLTRVGRMEPRVALPIVEQICLGLNAVHQAGLIHRDFKSANVILVNEGDGSRAVVTDFGLARLAPGSREASSSSEAGLVGTVAYMAPEQVEGARLTPAADIYALGTVCYEMVTGRLPFTADTPISLAVKRLETRPTPPREWAPDLPPAWEETILRCLARDPRDRYSSTLQIAEALTRGKSVGRRQQRTRWVAGAAAALALGLAGLMYTGSRTQPPPHGVTHLERADSPEATALAVIPFENLSGDADSDYIAAGISDVLVTNLATVPGLVVAAQSSTLPFRRAKTPVEEIRSKLAVSHVVTGTVHRESDRVRVAIRLERAGSVPSSWSGVFDGPVDQVFDLQHQIFEAIASQLETSGLIRSAEATGIRGLPRAAVPNPAAFAAYARGRILLEASEISDSLSRAMRELDDAVRLEPDFVLAHAARAQAYWLAYRNDRDSSNAEQARDAAVRALELDPDLPTVRYALAVIYEGTAREEQAVEELERILKSQPASDEAYRLLGRIYFRRGELSKGEASFAEAMRLRPDFAPNYTTLGLAFFRLGRYRDAADWFEKVLALEPDNAAAFQRLGTAYHALGELTRAAENYEQATQIAPTATAHSNLGTIYYMKERYEEALAAYNASIALRPNVPSSHRNLGDVYAKLGRPDDAGKAFEDAIRLSRETLRINPEDVSTMALLALCEAKLGRYDEATERIDEASAIDPDNHDVLYQHAAVLALVGRTEEAMDLLEKAIANGHSSVLLASDDDFETLRTEPRFQKLIAK